MKPILIIIFSAIILMYQLPSAHAAEHDLLKKIKRDSCRYFKHFTNPKTGLTADSSTAYSPSSIAATGFQLMSLIVSVENGWISRKSAYKQTEKVLITLRDKVDHERGFFYHFISMKSGKRVWQSEASSIDTALVIANCLLAGEYFKGTAVEKIAHHLYERVDWNWMLNGSELMSHGWKPESGFLPYYWDSYSEHLILQALAIGASKHAISPSCWNAWLRIEDQYQEIPVIYAHSGSLFTYQFSELFINFEKLFDGKINYRENAKNATLANRSFSEANRAEYKSYEAGLWGLSACLGPKGYKAYGAKPGRGFHDGTIAPYSVISALIVTPEKSLKLIKQLYNNYRKELYGPYGFKDGINLDKNWVADTWIGIDQGASLGMIENYQSGLIWKLFMSLEPVQHWIRLSGLTPELPAPAREVTVTPSPIIT